MKELFLPHPFVAAPTLEQISQVKAQYGTEKASEILAGFEAKRRERIAQEKEDPFRYGFVLPVWEEAAKQLESSTLLSVFGGNGAAKTWFGAWYGIQLLVKKPGAKVLWLHEAEQSSIDTHQRFCFHYLPKEWKNLKSDNVTKIRYKVATGFSDNKFVLPNGSMARFGFYNQDVSDYEGGGWDLVHADENLPLAWLKTMLFRLPRCNGRMLWTFTPIRGITPAIKFVVDGARTLEHRPAPLLPDTKRNVEDCPPGTMPYLQESTVQNAKIMYFFSEMNPAGGYEQLAQLLKGLPEHDTERRAYGYARNVVASRFPKFGAANILPHDRLMAIIGRDRTDRADRTDGVTRYHVADPASARNMFQLWVAVDKEGRHYVYREWPDMERFGEWAVIDESGKRWDGTPGPAQPTLGYGVVDYKRIIAEEENGEEIWMRYMDPRSGAAVAVAENSGGISLMDRFLEEQTDGSGKTWGSLEFTAAPGLRESEGETAINDLLAWDKSQPLTPLLNEPKLYVSDRCRNLIWALQSYTGNDGERGACKDPIDCLRYVATAKCEHVDGKSMAGWGSRGGY